MTKKVAIGQAFRLCFPDEFGGMPYEESEMPLEERNVTPHENENGNGHGNGDSLAGEALSHDDTNGKPPKTQMDQKFLIDGIKAMISAENPDQIPYFNDKEKEIEKKRVENTRSLEELNELYVQLVSELEKREKNYKPIPFEDKMPPVYTEPEPEFKNDYPFDEDKPANNGKLDIF
jgi:hypothetical protein